MTVNQYCFFLTQINQELSQQRQAFLISTTVMKKTMKGDIYVASSMAVKWAEFSRFVQS